MGRANYVANGAEATFLEPKDSCYEALGSFWRVRTG